MKNEKLWAQIVFANGFLNLSTHQSPLLIKEENILFFIKNKKTALKIKNALKIRYIAELPDKLEPRSYVVTQSSYGYDMYECHWSINKILQSV